MEYDLCYNEKVHNIKTNIAPAMSKYFSVGSESFCASARQWS